MGFRVKLVAFIINVVSLGFISFFFPKTVFAGALNWHRSSGIEDYSQEIRVAPSSPDVIYATIRNSSGSGLYKSSDLGVSFSLMFPITSGRDVNSIAISSTDSGRLWIGTYEKGIFKSTDGGGTWEKAGLDTVRIRFLTIDPTDDNVLYAGAGEIDSDGGIYKTTNGGTSWNLIGESDYGRKNCLNIYVDPALPSRILAGSGYNLYMSTNSGSTWKIILNANTNYPATLISNVSNSTIYAAVVGSGINRSTDNGLTWELKNGTMGASSLFRLAQTKNGTLFASRRTENTGVSGGVWRSKDGADTWENVADASWSGHETWGLDIGGERVFVSVAGLGTYYADVFSDESTSLTPVVFIPGFGGSWSYKGIIENQPTTYADWKLMPVFTDSFYQPFLSTLQNAGVTPYVFAYDFRKSVADSASSLNDYLGTVIGKKANVIGHSMGGLVARHCYEKIAGCADKINKIITAGTPHQGTIKAYQLWEAGQIDNDDLWMKTIEEIILHATSWPYLTDKDIIQNKFPGVSDLLPLSPPVTLTAPFLVVSTFLSGQAIDTYSGFSTVDRSPLDKALGLWIHGKPGTYTFAPGDGTVLKTSSEGLGGTNKYYSFGHNDYLRTTNSLTDILNIFGLTAGSIVTETTSLSSILAFIIHSPATITVNGQTDKAIFIKNPSVSDYNVQVNGTGDGIYLLDAFYLDGGLVVHKSVTGTVSPGSSQNLTYHFTGQADQEFISNPSNLFLSSFRQKIATVSNHRLNAILNKINEAIDDIQTGSRIDKAYKTLEKGYLDILNLLASEDNPSNRNVYFEASNYLLEFIAQLGKDYYQISPKMVNEELARDQKFFGVKLKSGSIDLRKAANLYLAQKMFEEAQKLSVTNTNLKAYLLAKGAGALIN